MNNDPFEFLDEEEDEIEEEEEKGLAWLPLTLAGIALVGFLTIPLLGLLKPGKKSIDWSDFTSTDAIEVKVDSESVETPLLTPSPEDLTTDLQSIDETLSGLGRVSAQRGVETKASLTKTAAPTSNKKVTRLVPVRKAETKQVAAQSDRLTKVVTIKPGDTLYGIARENDSSPDEIAGINGIQKNAPIKPGQRIRVPARSSGPVVQKSSSGSKRVTQPAVPKPNRFPRPVASGNQRQPVAVKPTAQPPQRRAPQPVQPKIVAPAQPAKARPTLFPTGPKAQPKEGNPLDKYNHAIAYRVQTFDNINRIADAHATTPDELIELNGRASVKKGEMLVVPVDNCLIKND